MDTATLRILPNKGFDYVNSGSPSTTVNPRLPFATWLDTSTGKIFVCTDNTLNANVWVDQRPSFRGAFVYKALAEGDQSITTSVNTVITFAAEAYDTSGFHEGIVNPSRLTIPADVSLVRLSAAIAWQGVSGGYRICNFIKNGSDFPGANRLSIFPNTTAGAFSGTHSPVIEVSEGDYFEVQVFQNSGSSVNVLANDAGRSTFALEVIA